MLNELRLARKYWPISTYLSIQDIKSRFRRSNLGILWVIIQQLSFSLGAGLIWAAVFHQTPSDFIPFLTVGFSVWGFISSVMTEGCGSFVVAHGYLKQLPLPQSIFIFRTLLTQLFFLAIGLLVAIGVLIGFGKFSWAGAAACVPGLVILCLYAYGAIGTLAYLGLRYRDLQHGLSGLFSLLFVITPVIYPPDVLLKKGFQIAIYGNPFASLIEIIRAPLLKGNFAGIEHYIIATTFALFFVFLRFFIGKKWERYVPYWS